MSVRNGRELRILISGGGTGGHVSPALAVVQAIENLQIGSDWTAKFLYVGSVGGVEGPLAAQAGIPYRAVATGKLRRSANPLGMFTLQNLADLARVPFGVIQAIGILLSFRPDVVLSTGGYVSVPAMFAAAITGVPILSHEQTAQIGLGNRLALRFAKKIALSFEIPEKEISAAARRKVIVTGNPVRPVVLAGDAQRARTLYGFDESDPLPTVYVTGGAQGAHVINEAVRAGLAELLAFCRIVHQCGKQPKQDVQDLDALKGAAGALPEDLRRRYAVTSFVGAEIGDVFALADLVVCRSGAGTVAEVAALGKPAVYVPLVPTGGDEQRKNARRFADLGAAVVLESASLTGTLLVETLRGLFADRAKLEAMGAAAKTMARPDAGLDLARELLDLAGMKIGSESPET